MNCIDTSKMLNFQCKPVADGLFFLQSPLVMAFDNQNIGVYVQEISKTRYRITDNSDILFAAQTLGLNGTRARGAALDQIAQKALINLSDDGELYAVCDRSELQYYLARFMDAATRITQAVSDWLPKPSDNITRFDITIGNALAKHFTSQLKRNYTVYGASGHQLNFPFAIDSDDSIKLIQTVSSSPDQPKWDKVYHTLGKLADVRNADPDLKRYVVLEGSSNDIETHKAISALADCSKVILYQDDKTLLKALAA